MILMADHRTDFDRVREFGFLLFAALVVVLYSAVILVCQVFDVHSRAAWLYVVEVAIDVILLLFTFFGGVFSATKCQDEVQGEGECQGSAAFCLFASLCFVGSVIISFQHYRNPPKGSRYTNL